jgi:hypothetical protein
MYSSKLNNAEKNYTTTEKEGSAVIKTLKFFKPIVFGSEIIVFSDNLNLSFIQKSTSPINQRWRIFPEELSIQIKFVKGIENMINWTDFFDKFDIFQKQNIKGFEELMKYSS